VLVCLLLLLRATAGGMVARAVCAAVACTFGGAVELLRFLSVLQLLVSLTAYAAGVFNTYSVCWYLLSAS
jgi:phage shock protein PspC (stress-responsive transcriptional regulator)